MTPVVVLMVIPLGKLGLTDHEVAAAPMFVGESDVIAVPAVNV